MKYILVNFKTNKNWLEITDYFKEIENFCDENKINNEKNIFFLTSLHILLAIQKFPVINFGNQSGSQPRTMTYSDAPPAIRFSVATASLSVLGS